MHYFTDATDTRSNMLFFYIGASEVEFMVVRVAYFEVRVGTCRDPAEAVTTSCLMLGSLPRRSRMSLL